MSWSSRIRTWWKAVTQGPVLDRELDEELRFHIHSYAEDLMRRGMSRDEAMRRARAELGSVAAGKENCRAAWGTRWLDELRGDLRYALRMLARSPGFAAIAIGSLALGIGANTVIFTAAQHMLLDRLAVPHPEQLRLLHWTEPQTGVVQEMWGEFDDLPQGGEVSTSFSYPVYLQLRRENQSLANIFAFKPYGRITVTIDGQAGVADAEMVSGNYYSSLEVQPQLGRGIQESDDGAVGSGPVITISDKFWTRRFARSPNVIGKTILLNTTPMTIVGVNPPAFTGAYSAQDSPDVFLPFSMQPIVVPQNMDPTWAPSLLGNKELWWVLVMGRIKPVVSDAPARASLNVALKAAIRATMTVKKDNDVPALLLEDGSRGQNPSAELAQPIYVLMGLAGFVLLLACANLANLLLARAGARQREMSVRLALGAPRARILRQMMTESLLLSLTGGIAGLALAWVVRNAIPRLLADSWSPPAFAARFSLQIFAFAAAISIITGLIFGFAPAWQSARVTVSSGLKDSGQTVTHRRRGLAGKTLVVIQVALSMLLVVGAGLFVQTLMRLSRTPVGFSTHNLLLFGVQPPRSRYPGATSITLLHRIEDKLAAVPGVQSVTLTRVPLISGNVSNITFIPEGQQRKPQGNPSVFVNDVGNDFFTTFRIPILAGRGFNAGDTATSRKVAVISEQLTRKYFPNLNPVGRTFQTNGTPPATIEIVGVCADAKYYTLKKDSEPTYYAPYSQASNGISEATFAVSTRLPGQTLLPSLREAVRSVDTSLPMLDVRTQDEQIAATLQHEQIFANLTGGFGVLALVLACIGIYGIMAYSVSRRTNEIGIRMTLGAQPSRVLRMVLGEASWLAAAGILVGLGAALALGRLVASLLYGLKFWDPVTLVVATTLLSAVALTASWIPARRAAAVDPMRALRHE
jgi:predicted permease